MPSSASSGKSAARTSVEPSAVAGSTTGEPAHGVEPEVAGVTSAKQRRRKRISDAATMLFGERGFDAVSIADIAEASGVSKMTVTNHFALKEDLIFDEFDDEVRRIRDVVTGADGIAAAVDAVERYCEQREREGGTARALAFEQIPDAWPRFARIVLSSRALTQRLHAHYLELRDAIASALPASVALADATTTAWLLAETVHLVDWWPYEAVDRGLDVSHIRRERIRIRTRAFEALRNGLPG
ncbi:TetR/AcrR family transcriptional regulator [Planctomonas sp. JC2975]|uniref:TetR/AcrR family transcriptional regulator n=1 Tax=Planctomonas sp. JC2975 TaxID=2729626 RepID=UPI001472EE97|nr:TetR/AcrR family transcriptional regulator [Planctomonas sp. JC2975]NNC11941.1 TetR/AcrR family transcriptional regulator [Planctomonas sp. JC2975]